MADFIERSKAIEVADLLERECQYDHGVSPRIAAALRALPAASDGWQDIESAPKDGSTIVVAAYCGYNKMWVFRLDYWRHMDGNGGWGSWDHHRSHWSHLPTIEAAIALRCVDQKLQTMP